jgi:RND family efflux transporter MFP subunit
MTNKKIIIFICLAIMVLGGGFFIINKPMISLVTADTNVQFVSSTINADGLITSQSVAKLSFLTSGKLAYLKVKEGDEVKAGQVIAALDLGDLQAAWNRAHYTYEAADAYAKQIEDQVKGHDSDETFAQKTTRVAAQTARDTAYDLMLSAQRAIDNALLKAPFDGVVTHEDVSMPGINVTPNTSFTVADPETKIFRANVPAGNIDYVNVGNSVTLVIDGVIDKLEGQVVKIFPTKVTLGNGQTVYQVDIASEGLFKSTKLDQTGKAIITTNSENVALIPVWVVLGGKYVWLDVNGKPTLKEITVGKIHGNEIEVTSGLLPTDKIITNPKYLPFLKYILL